MPCSVADVVVDELVAAGVARVFTAGPGSSLDPLTVAARARGLVVVETGASNTAAMMAAVTGELGETPGVLVLAPTDAVGAVAGLSYAGAARAPLLLICSGALEAVSAPRKDIVRPTRESAGEAISNALRLALDDPRGPVHLVLPPDLAAAPAGAAGMRGSAIGPRAAAAPPAALLDEAARILAAAARPVLVIGLRCRNAVAWLRALAEAVPMPALATLKGKGVLPDPHPLMLGPLSDGRALFARSDLVVTVGLDPLEEMAGTWPPTLPRLDLGATADSAVERGDVVRVGGDVALIIEELAPRLRDRPRADWDVAELDRLKRGRRAAPPSGELSPTRVVEVVRALMPAGTIAAADEGPYAAVVAAAWQTVGPNQLLIGPGSPRQPFAPAAALAASLARSGARTVAFTDAPGLAAAGDAVATARRLQVPVVLIGLGAAAGEAPPGAAALNDDELASALHSALAGSGPLIIQAGVRRERESPV
ncbi:MAG TPA: thiamine pyrophosphate-binding protein [Methylomirabilota bacterium]|nr:thiamine pyrophosphate-binding protein [Methylomirabilota bacterium]